MIVIRLKESPASFHPMPGDPTTKKHGTSIVVFSRKNSPKRMMQIRKAFQSASGWDAEIINVHLSGEESAKLADALKLTGSATTTGSHK